MATYGDMQARIADEMMGAPITTTHIQNAIQDAIKRYQEDRFYFNLLRTGDSPVLDRSGAVVLDGSGAIVFDSGGFITIAGQEFYPVTSWALDAYTAHIDTITIVAFDSRYSLRPQTPQWFEDNSVGVAWRSLPTDWTYESESIRLYPIPDQTYPVIVTGTQIFAALANSTDSNPWTNDGEELIRTAAESMLYSRISRDQGMAQVMAADEQRALATLRRKTSQRGAPARLRIRSWF